MKNHFDRERFPRFYKPLLSVSLALALSATLVWADDVIATSGRDIDNLPELSLEDQVLPNGYMARLKQGLDLSAYEGKALLPSQRRFQVEFDYAHGEMLLKDTTLPHSMPIFKLAADESNFEQAQETMVSIKTGLQRHFDMGGRPEDIRPLIDVNKEKVELAAGHDTLFLMAAPQAVTPASKMTLKQRQDSAYELANNFRSAYGLQPLDIPPLPQKKAAMTDALSGLQLKSTGQLLTGMASWYGPGFHGRRTASGERFDMNALTAASRTLPFGTLVKVTNKNNGKNVVVRITDRGPFAHGRILDVSKGAAQRIGLTSSGVAPIVMEVMKK